MTEWAVVYISAIRREETRWEGIQTEAAALTQAHAINGRGGVILRIDGPADTIITAEQFKAWLSENQISPRLRTAH
jgi:hypothetical protein